MTTHTETYLGCEIEIQDDKQLKINSKLIDTDFDAERKKWSTRYLPYSEFDSLEELSRAVTRDSVEFTEARV
jgi:hypothetical protein